MYFYRVILHKHNAVLTHIYQLDETVSNFRGVVGWYLSFIKILKDTSVSKQWGTWSDAAKRGVWSGFVLRR